MLRRGRRRRALAEVPRSPTATPETEAAVRVAVRRTHTSSTGYNDSTVSGNSHTSDRRSSTPTRISAVDTVGQEAQCLPVIATKGRKHDISTSSEPARALHHCAMLPRLLPHHLDIQRSGPATPGWLRSLLRRTPPRPPTTLSSTTGGRECRSLPWGSSPGGVRADATTPQSWMTCANDGQDHTFAHLPDGPAPAVRALCEHLVLPAALCAPPGPRCRRCRSLAAARWAAVPVIASERSWTGSRRLTIDGP